MAIIVILILIYAFVDYKKTDHAKKEIYKSHEEKKARYKEWENKVKNEDLEKEIWDSLSNLKYESPYYKELLSIYNELGITNRKYFTFTTKDKEVTMILMANRGYLPYCACGSDILGYYRSDSDTNIYFKENSSKIIPWANEKLKQRGICENVYASTFLYGYDFYLVGSAAYYKVIEERGFAFTHYMWEPQVMYNSLNKIHY